MRRLLTVLFLAAAGAAAAAEPPPPPPPVMTFMGRDQVLIGRIYWRAGGSTQPLGRFGMIITGKAATQVVPATTPEGGTFTATFSARRSGEDAAQVSWSLQPGSGLGIPAADGRLVAKEGSVGHVALGSAGGTELFASLETGRASVFNLQRLWEHFGIATDAQRFAPAVASQGAFPPPEWVRPAAASAQAPPRGGSLTMTCPSGRAYELSTGSGTGRCSLDVEGDRVAGGTCDDGAGNLARASCALNAGAGACLETSGTGSCRTP